MYRRILVAVENSPADKTILTHVSELARLTGAELLGFVGNLALTPLSVRILQGLLPLLSHLLGLARGLRLTASQAFGTSRVGLAAYWHDRIGMTLPPDASRPIAHHRSLYPLLSVALG